ncbi:hypothetical protein [Flavobacterium sp. AG291]|uniref:DUF7674 family protein n=1 Tax=Flavobacterium sp. AG291 TaxID=2184000 RepID=UPI000E0B9717|nr:hypothetical protein [Flavobacterium sp. AG291]
MKNQVKPASAKVVQFAEITKSLIRKGNIPRAKKCLEVAERLLTTGNAETKNLIVNIYIFSVSTFMELRKCNIANMFPQSLRKEYIAQINTSGV